MAINVDQVYKTVLLIINKEQRGYLTPDEFNKIGRQVQLEIFDTYFDTLNQQIRVPQNDSDYANRVKSVNEKIEIFKRVGACTYFPADLTIPISYQNYGYFTVPSSSSTPTANQSFASVSLQTDYEITSFTQAQAEDSTVTVTKDGVLMDSSLWSITGGNLVLTPTVATGSTLVVTIYPKDFYKLGTIIYNEEQELQPITRSELIKLNLSSYTKPSTAFPVYLYEQDRVIVYPESIKDNIQASYVKKPNDPTWNFTTDADNTYQYNPTTSVDFELDAQEQTNVILQILLYAGVVIKDPSIVQAAAQEIAQQEQNEKI